MPIDPEYLKHQYLYVPWIEGKDIISVGKALGLYVAREHNSRLTVVCPLKSNANHHKEFAKLPVVTERSGQVADGGVVLAWCPTRKLMDKIHHLEKSIVVLVEWPTANFEAWANLVGAYNIVTGEVMTANLSDNATKALEGIVWEGYNGWHDSTAEILTTSRLKELAELGEYDRSIVIEYASQHRRQTSIQRLERILDRFERSRVVV